MRIRPARLAALLLGKRSSPPFYGMGLQVALRLLRLASAPIESQIEAIAQAQGSSLWLEDFLESLECQSTTQFVIDNIITLLIEGEGQIFWQSALGDENQVSLDAIKSYFQTRRP